MNKIKPNFTGTYKSKSGTFYCNSGYILYESKNKPGKYIRLIRILQKLHRRTLENA
jgi:hypothetical protein